MGRSSRRFFFSWCQFRSYPNQLTGFRVRVTKRITLTCLLTLVAVPKVFVNTLDLKSALAEEQALCCLTCEYKLKKKMILFRVSFRFHFVPIARRVRALS